MKEAFKQKLFSNLTAVGIFLALSLAFSYPVLQGDVLNQHDNLNWQAMASEAKTHYETTGETPLWSNSMFGGMPTYTHYLGGITNVTSKIQAFVQDIFPKPIYFLFFAMLGAFILLSSLRLNKWVAIFGAIVYAFASYHLQIIAAGHDTKMISLAFMPIAIAGMIMCYRGKFILGAISALAGLAFTIQNGMYQIDYYLLIVMFLLGIAFLIKAVLDKTIKQFLIASGIVIFCGALSVLPNLLQVSLTKEYGKYTMRGGQSEITITNKPKKENGGLDKDYAFQWSQGVGETFTLFVPNLYGAGAGSGLYWGDQPFLSGPFYLGILTMLLMVLGLALIKNRLKWVFFGIGMFGVFLALGRNFSSLNYFLFDHLPMYNSFRTPNMSMTIPSLMFVVLAFWALHEFFTDQYSKDEKWKALKIGGIVTGAIVLVFGFMGGLFLDFKSPKNDNQLKMQIAQQYQAQGISGAQAEQGVQSYYNDIVEQRATVVKEDGIRSFLFLAIGFVILFLFAKQKIKKRPALLIIGIIAVIDMLSIGTRYLKKTDDVYSNYVSQEKYEDQFAPRPVDLAIKQDTDPYYRVYDLSRNVYNDAIQALHHKCVGGYHAAKMESYQDLIDVHLTPGQKINQQVLNMLNTKYIIFNANGQATYQANPGALGNAWFVDSVRLVKTADEEMLGLDAEQIGDTVNAGSGFRPNQWAVVRDTEWKGQNTQFTKAPDATISLTKYGLNDLSFSSNNANDGFAVFSDIYYELGWKAYIDKKEVPIIKTNFLLRGLNIPAGQHEIVFKFEPSTYTTLKPISIGASYLIFFLLLGGIGFIVKKEWSNEEKVEASLEEKPEIEPLSFEKKKEEKVVPAKKTKKKRKK